MNALDLLISCFKIASISELCWRYSDTCNRLTYFLLLHAPDHKRVMHHFNKQHVVGTVDQHALMSLYRWTCVQHEKYIRYQISKTNHGNSEHGD